MPMINFRLRASSREGTVLIKTGPFINLSRRKFLMQYCQGAWLASLPAGLGFPPFRSFLPPQVSSPESEFDLQPQYRAPRALDAVLKKVQPGLDAFITENYEAQVAAILGAWSSELLVSPQKTGALEEATAAFGRRLPAPGHSLLRAKGFSESPFCLSKGHPKHAASCRGSFSSRTSLPADGKVGGSPARNRAFR